MLGHRLQRWPNIKSALGQRLVLLVFIAYYTDAVWYDLSLVRTTQAQFISTNITNQ